jgi:hypothetical protein
MNRYRDTAAKGRENDLNNPREDLCEIFNAQQFAFWI